MSVNSRTFCIVWFYMNSPSLLLYLGERDTKISIWNKYFISQRYHNYKLIIGYQCRQEMGKIPIFTDSEWFKTPKLDSALKVYQDKEFYQLRFQVC